MHAITLFVEFGVAVLCGLWAWSIHDALSILTQDVVAMNGLTLKYFADLVHQLEETHAAMQSIAPHVVAIRATLESVVRVDQPRSSLEPQLQGLTESISILKGAIEQSRVSPEDIHAQFGGLQESVDLLRSSIHERAAEPPRVQSLEAPQVPRPHGEPKTLLLMNQNHSVAHTVTWHRDVPKTFAYAGRVFELLGVNEAGAWEFLPC